MTDYETYRGKCKEMSEALVAERPELTLVRGHYHCPYWGEQQHWWCVDPEGNIVDPTAKQFPSKGTGLYIPFDGMCECAECGAPIHETKAIWMSHYPVCSDRCARSLVGI